MIAARRRAAAVLRAVEDWSERLLLRSTGPGDSTPRSGHVLVAGPGGGSIGDEAMLAAFLDRAPQPVTVVLRRDSDALRSEYPGESTRVVLPGLLYGGLRSRRRDLRRFLDLARSAETVSIIGADTMDGVYSVTSSVRRFRTARFAAACGSRTRVLGFSWNSAPAPPALHEMRRCDRSVELLARDGVSADRLLADGAVNVVRAADLAFLTRASTRVEHSIEDWLDEQEAQQRPIVLVNANPRLATHFPGQPEQYLRLIDAVRSAGCSVLLLPHDSRGGADSEEAYLGVLHGALARDAHTHLATSVQLPADVVSIAGRCTLTVSGRMHLVVLSSVAGTPCVGLEYQGKFEGLFELLGYDGRVSPPPHADGWDLAARAMTALHDGDAVRARLAAQRPHVTDLARRNLPLPAESATESAAR